jgi:hypothetical protein
MHELRLAQPVDGRNDQADPRCRNLNAVRAGVFDRDGVHDGSPVARAFESNVPLGIA